MLEYRQIESFPASKDALAFRGDTARCKKSTSDIAFGERTMTSPDVQRTTKDGGRGGRRRRLVQRLVVLVALPGLSVVYGLALRAGTPGGEPIEQQLRITAVRPLVDERPPFPLVESYLALNPADPTNLLASAMSVSGEESVVYGSWDAGETWALVDGPQGRVFPGGDPMLTFDGNGRAYFATISPAIGVWRSADGGRTWEGPAAVGDDSRFDDREWLAVRGTPGPVPLPLYAVAKTSREVEDVARDVIIGATSADGGRTFTEPAVLSVDSGFLQAAGHLLVRGDDALVMLYLVNYERLGDGTFRGRIWLRTASGPELDWSDASFVADYPSYGESGGDRRWKGLGVMPMAIDETRGRFDGTMYMTWAAPVDDRLQILTARSTDSGRTWSEPLRVIDAGFRSNHSSPMIAINGGGVVVVSWNDRRDDPSDRCFRPYAAASFDGGRSFGRNQMVAERLTCPGQARWLNGGETHGLVALPDGGFRLVWSSGDARGLALWTARIAAPTPR